MCCEALMYLTILYLAGERDDNTWRAAISRNVIIVSCLTVIRSHFLYTVYIFYGLGLIFVAIVWPWYNVIKDYDMMMTCSPNQNIKNEGGHPFISSSSLMFGNILTMNKKRLKMFQILKNFIMKAPRQILILWSL